MKPDWKDAPEYANWLSWDTRDWFWSANKPVWDYENWTLVFTGDWEEVGFDPGYSESRPNKGQP